MNNFSLFSVYLRIYKTTDWTGKNICNSDKNNKLIFRLAIIGTKIRLKLKLKFFNNTERIFRNIFQIGFKLQFQLWIVNDRQIVYIEDAKQNLYIIHNSVEKNVSNCFFVVLPIKYKNEMHRTTQHFSISNLIWLRSHFIAAYWLLLNVKKCKYFQMNNLKHSFIVGTRQK